jgi:hypothetical protein
MKRFSSSFSGAVAVVRRVSFVMLVLISAGALGACAPTNMAVQEGGPGFWYGLVHGWAAPVAFIVSLFRDDVGVYAVANTGAWYDFGFLFGLSFWGGGGGAAASRRRKRSASPPAEPRAAYENDAS